MNDFVQTAPYDPSARGTVRGMIAKFATRHDFLWLGWRTIRWLVLHPITLAGVITAGWLWSAGLPFLVAAALGSIPHVLRSGWELGRLVDVALRRHPIHILPRLSNQHPNNPSLLGMWWKIHRGWSTGIRKAGFLQPGRGGAIPALRHWELTNQGMSAWVACGRFGWTADDLAAKSSTIAAGIKRCRAVTVTQGQFPGIARVDFAFSDPLGEPIPITKLPAPRVGYLACGITDRGDPAYLDKGLSTLVVGLPGSGKSNFLWTLIAAELASGEPFELWVFDPAGGVELWELSNGSPLVRSYAATPGDMRRQVRELHAAMMQRMAGMAGKARLHKPTKEEPRMIVVVDEWIKLYYAIIAETKPVNHERLMTECQSLGRKAALTILGITQIPFAHSIGEKAKYLFPQKVVFRSSDFMVTNAVFGGGSESIVEATKIPASQPGIGYMILDEDVRPVRFRAPLITDALASLIARGFLPDGIPTVGDAGQSWHNNEHVLYRWDNARLVPPCRYVGISVNGVRRADEHLSNEAKAELREPGVTMTIVERFNVDSHAAELEGGQTVKQIAEAVEKRMIQELGPPLNVAHNGARRRRKAIEPPRA